MTWVGGGFSQGCLVHWYLSGWSRAGCVQLSEWAVASEVELCSGEGRSRSVKSHQSVAVSPGEISEALIHLPSAPNSRAGQGEKVATLFFCPGVF